MRTLNSKSIWLSLALTCLVLVVASFVLTAQLHLHPCHLCILQRLLFMLLSGFTLLAAVFSPGLTSRLIGILALATSATGIGVAGYQIWLQAQPMDPFSCTSGTPELIEHMVDWLGRLAPEMFMATGLCQEVELRILTLSLAGWALIAFSAALIAGGVALWSGRKNRPGRLWFSGN
ncbi:MAG: disulfide bond formation protein B [Parasulfuritortus sp.]|nr:disulfide bond formation protein B [Parasulfuritortus sp.]